jgi:crotonobetainyl-CoA:carnitine CoA-transferase CaiB-like acyl-CoA transferase
MLLADFGSAVLRVTPAGSDDIAKNPGAAAWNRNKYALPLDLDGPEGRARFEALAKTADMVVLDQGPSRLKALGLESDALAARHPGLSVLWLPPFGVRGRWSDNAPHHALLMGLSGAAFRQGAWSHKPVWHVTPLVHYAQATLGAGAAAAALLEQTRTGLGRAVTVSGLHALSQVACPLTPAGAEGMGRGSPLGDSPNYRLYPCGDGEWLFLGTLFNHFFARAIEVLELEPRDLHDAGQAIGARLRTAPRAHWMALFHAAEVPAAPVSRREDWLAGAIACANELATRLPDHDLGAVRAPGVLARLHATPGAIRHPFTPAPKEVLTAFARPRPVTPKEAKPAAPTPLKGVRVLDLGTVIAGAYAGAILANLGADVVKIEPPQGDPFRFAMTGFINYNRGKRGLGLDLKAPEGRDLFLDLARGADVVLDNYRLGVRERLGIDYQTLRALNPRLISCSSNTYGARGPGAARPGFDPLIQAESGLMAAQGGEGSEPVFHTLPINDVAAAALTAFAIIAALNAREVTGEGQEVETSLAGASTLYQFEELVAFEGRRPVPSGGRDFQGFSALEHYYPCRGGWLTLAASAEVYPTLARVLGVAPWPGDVATEGPEGPLATALAAAFAGWDRDEAVTALLEAGVPAAPTWRPDEATACETLWENRYYQIHDHPQWGELVGSRGFAAFDGQDCAYDRLDPRLGEHGLEVLLDYGVAYERIRALAQAGVIFQGR